MQARSFPASRGWFWLRAGFGLWRRAPLVLTGACMTMSMLLFVSALVPTLGQILPALLLSPLGVGMFRLCTEVRNGRFASPGMLFSGFRLNLSRQFVIGALRLLGQLLCVLIAARLAGLDASEPLGRLSEDGNSVSLSPHLESFMLWGMALGLPLELCFWFSPQLVALGNIAPLKAVFFNIVSCWRNLGAILVGLFLWVVIFGLLPTLVLNLIGSALPALGSVMLIPLFLVMMPVFYGSFHASACDIFDGALEQ